METTNLNDEEDRRLEALLQAGLGRPELPDGGFSRRVRRALAAESLPRYRAWLILGWCGLGSAPVLAAWALASAPASELGGRAALLDDPWIMTGVAVAAACAAATWRLASRLR